MPDEKKILEENCSFGNVKRGRIILSSKRLVIFQKKGLISQSYEKVAEIPLEEITEVYSEVRAITGCYMKFRVKGGDWGMVSFPSTGANLFMGGIYGHEKSQKAVTDRWINAIKIARKDNEKSETQDPLKLLQLRLAKGEISKQEYEELKKLLEE